MSLTTTARQLWHGATDRNGATISVLRNYTKVTTVLTDFSTNLVNGVAVDAPTGVGATGTGRDGTDMFTYDGTNDGHDLGTALAALINTALNDGVGVSVGFDLRHSSAADRDAIFDGVDGSVRNGIRIGVNYNNLYNAGAHTLCVNMIDNAGNSLRPYWDISNNRILTDGLSHRVWVLLTKTFHALYIDGTLVAPTSTGGSALGAFNAAATHKYGFACTGFGAGISTGEAYNGVAGNLCVVRGILTEAQIRADVGIHELLPRSSDGTPLTRVWRADTNLTTGLASATSADVWDSTDGQVSLVEASADDPGSGVAGLLVPTYFANGPFTKFNTAPCVGFSNVFGKNGFDADAHLGGHIRQTMKSVSLTGNTFNGSNITIWFAARIPVWALLGNTVQNIVDLWAGGTRRIAIGFQNGRLVIYGPAGAVRDASTTDVLDCRNGPSLVYGEITVAPDATCTIRMNRWRGATTSVLSVGNLVIDEIRVCGTQGGDGGDCANAFLYEFGLAETVALSSEQTTRMARIFSQYGGAGETSTPTKHMVAGAGSLFSVYSERGQSVVMRFPAECVNNTSWCVVDQQGQSVDHTSNDFASHDMNNAAKKDPGASWHGLLVALCTNDDLAGNSVATINTELGTALASVSGFNWKGAVGLHDYDGSDPTTQANYQALINARVPATLNIAINQRTTDGLMVPGDPIHGAGDAYQQQLADDIWYGSPGGVGGGLAAVLGVPAGGARSRDYRSRNWR